MTLKVDHSFSSSRSLAVSYFFLKGTDTQPLSLTGNIPWVDRDFSVETAEPERRRHVDSELDEDQSAALHLRAAVRRARQQPDDVARRSELELQDSRRPHAAAHHGDRVLHRTDVDRRAPTPAAISSSVKDSMTMTRGNHSLKIGGEVSYEKIMHDTLLDNYGVFQFNASRTGNAYADFLLGLPSNFTQDAPIRKIDSGVVLQRLRAGRLPHPPARDVEPRPPLRPAAAADRSSRPQAGVRAGPEVAGVAERA